MIGRTLLLAAFLALSAYPSAAAEGAGLLALPNALNEPATVPPLSRSDDRAPPPASPDDRGTDYRQLMRDIIAPLAAYARQRDPDFIILMRGGLELLIKTEAEARWEGDAQTALMPGVNGVVLDGLYCGRRRADGGLPVTANIRRALAAEGLRILAADHCPDEASRAAALAKAGKDGVLLHADTASGDTRSRRPPEENAGHVTALAAARNFLLANRPSGYRLAGEWVAALRETNYDMVIVAPYFGAVPLSAREVTGLRFKRLGSRRLALASLSLGVAMPGRHYWQAAWQPGTPSWLGNDIRGNGLVVKYWSPEWKEIIGGFLKGLMDLGYDGVMLDDVDVYAHFEKAATPIGKE